MRLQSIKSIPSITRLGIPHVIEGSKVYDVFVGRARAQEAIDALRSKASQRYCPVQVVVDIGSEIMHDLTDASKLNWESLQPKELLNSLLEKEAVTSFRELKSGLQVLGQEVQDCPFVRTIEMARRTYMDSRGADCHGLELEVAFAKSPRLDAPLAWVRGQSWNKGTNTLVQGCYRPSEEDS